MRQTCKSAIGCHVKTMVPVWRNTEHITVIVPPVLLACIAKWTSMIVRLIFVVTTERALMESTVILVIAQLAIQERSE